MARIISKGLSYDDVLISPKYNKVLSRKDVNLETNVTKNYKIKIPFIAANMDTVCESKMAIEIGKLGGLGVIHRFMTIEEQANEIEKVKKEGLITAAAIGVKDVEQRVKALSDSGVNIIVIDIAHGHSKYAGKTLDYIKENYPHLDVMAGNIATKDAAEYFFSKGADAVKVGIGPGGLCTTRIMTGAGIPQITAIMDVFEATQGKIPICADGGIKNPSDIVKAIGAGANTIMSGSLFAGTKESPGKILGQGDKQYKLYRGSASYDVSLKKAKLDGNNSDQIVSIEGEQTLLNYKGPIKTIIEKYIGGITSGMTYLGAKKMENAIGKADFVEITSKGYEKNHAYGLEEN